MAWENGEHMHHESTKAVCWRSRQQNTFYGQRLYKLQRCKIDTWNANKLTHHVMQPDAAHDANMHAPHVMSRSASRHRTHIHTQTRTHVPPPPTPTPTPTAFSCNIFRVGQDHIYTVHIRYFWQGNHQIYGHIRCIYTVLANPKHIYEAAPWTIKGAIRYKRAQQAGPVSWAPPTPLAFLGLSLWGWAFAGCGGPAKEMKEMPDTST